MPERKAISDTSELDKFFNMSGEKKEKMKGIRNRFKMPAPEDKAGLTVRLIGTVDEEGRPALVEVNVTQKFTTHVTRAEEIVNPGIINDIPVGASVYAAYTRAVLDNGLTNVNDLVGKVVTFTSSYWTGAPKNKRAKNPNAPSMGDMCPECRGKGCAFCTVTGTGEDAGVMTGLRTPIVFNCSLRQDMMGAVGAGAGRPDMGGGIATEF